MSRLIGHLPTRTMLKLLAAWIVLAIFNFALIVAGLNPGTPRKFPISVLDGPTIHLSGLPFAALFLLLLFFGLGQGSRLNVFQVWILGLALIVLGNLAQGGLDAAFYKPFYESGIQYYHDAIEITDWQGWLREFNVNQPGLLEHAKTHPPAAVLLHYLLLSVADGRLFLLAGSFTLISSLVIPLVWWILRTVGLSVRQCSLLALLFSVIPAVNIYSAVSLDGVIATLSTVFLLGMVTIIRRGISVSGVVAVLTGALLTNMLSFSGLFLYGTGLLLALREIILHKRYGLLVVLLISLLLGLGVYILMLQLSGYDHVDAFLTASRIENPNGFRAFHVPVEYVMTRVEGVAEIALFLSIPVLAILLHQPERKASLYSVIRSYDPILIAGLAVLLLILLAGAYRTGETARACLFIYPYLVLGLRNAQEPMLRSLISAAGLQTIVMQVFGGFFW